MFSFKFIYQGQEFLALGSSSTVGGQTVHSFGDIQFANGRTITPAHALAYPVVVTEVPTGLQLDAGHTGHPVAGELVKALQKHFKAGKGLF